jgi:hypothetical protein
VVLAIGLLACVAAALLTTGKGGGEAAQLEWVEKAPIPDSKAATVPGGGGKFRLSEGGLRATGLNVSGYELYRAAAVLSIDGGSPVGSARVHCSVQGSHGAEIAQTPGSRASYPRSSEELVKQSVPEVALVNFSSHSNELAVVEFGDAFGKFTEEPGIKVEWPEFNPHREQWDWFLPPGAPKRTLKLGFGSIWKTTAVPSAKIACTLTTSAGKETVRTVGALSKISKPIAE